MITEQEIIEKLTFTLERMRSHKIRTLVQQQESNSIKIKYRDLVWELTSLIREVENKRLDRELENLPRFNKQYSLSVKKLDRSLLGLQTTKNILNNIEQFVGIASRLFMLFS